MYGASAIPTSRITGRMISLNFPLDNGRSPFETTSTVLVPLSKFFVIDFVRPITRLFGVRVSPCCTRRFQYVVRRPAAWRPRQPKYGFGLPGLLALLSDARTLNRAV